MRVVQNGPLSETSASLRCTAASENVLNVIFQRSQLCRCEVEFKRRRQQHETFRNIEIRVNVKSDSHATDFANCENLAFRMESELTQRCCPQFVRATWARATRPRLAVNFSTTAKRRSRSDKTLQNA